MHDVNLIPAARLARRRRNARLRVWGAICGAYVMCLIASSTTLQALRASEDRSLNGQRATLAQQIEQANVDLQATGKELADATASLETTLAIHNQPDWSKLFVALSERCGVEIVLSRCQLTTLTGDNKVLTEQWIGSMPARPLGSLLIECRHTLVLSGFGTSQEAVSQFVLRLEATGLFRIVRLMSSSRQSFLDQEAVGFSVECHFEESR